MLCRIYVPSHLTIDRFSGKVGLIAQFKFILTLTDFQLHDCVCSGAHHSLTLSLFSNHRDNELRTTTMTSMTTKICGAVIGMGVFFALGSVMAHAQAFCDRCF